MSHYPIALAVVLFLLSVGSVRAALTVTSLRCDGRSEPLAVDDPAPLLSWQLESEARGDRQTAYQIRAATTLQKLADGDADLWDSGKVTSADSIGVPYAGRALKPGERAVWQVRAWDREGQPSTYSAASWWEAGLPADAWKALWIVRPREKAPTEAEMYDDDPAPLLRKEFALDKDVRRARLRVSGLGYYEARLNGRRVGDHVLDPGWTTYDKRVLYSTYDVTDQLNRGRNAIGILLGNGWYNPLPLRMWGKLNLREHLPVGEPRAIAQLDVEFTDGSTATIGTDDTWKAGDSPIVRNSVYLGEIYDARREQPGWDAAGFDDSKWKSAARASENVGSLHAQAAPPIRVTRTIRPVELTQPRPGVWIFDMGENFAGWARLRVSGPAGTRVRLRYAELLNADGSANFMTSACGQIKQGGPGYEYSGSGAPKSAWQQDEYVLKGTGGEETFTPHFTFHGFRYVEVTGFPGEPTLKSLDGLRLNSDLAPAGAFACSNEMFNRLQDVVQRTLLSNVFSVQSDCPHREKFGYGGDIVASSEMAVLNFDMSRFYAKAVEDLNEAQRANGGFTETAPYVGIGDHGLGEGSGPIEWGTGHPVLLAQLYQYYGDRRIMEQQYAPLRKWIELLDSRAKDYILDNGIGDHEAIEKTSTAITGTAFYYYNVKLFERIARTLGKTGDAEHAAQTAEKIKAAFNQKFLRPGTGRYGAGTQAAQSLALAFGLVADADRQDALAALVRDITESHQGHLTTGIFGTKFMLEALSESGRADVAYQIADQRTFPGWGYMLENGATTLWEHWAMDDHVFSRNHPMFGSVSEWFYKGLAGIAPAPDAVGFDKILIRPQPVGDVTWVRSHHDSIRGRIVSELSREGGTLALKVRVPVGAVAIVSVPATGAAAVTEGGNPLDRVPGIRPRRAHAGVVDLEVPSGEYNFAVTEK
jgi:alpha-L-rhamnosidase